MKRTLRYFAALLMLISGIWHIVLFFITPGGVPLLVFGILFAFVGMMLFRPGRLGLYLGLIPVTGICTALIAVGLKNLTFSMSALVIIDVVVISISIYLLFSKINTIKLPENDPLPHQ